MTVKQEQITQVIGRVKWFDPVKGFGFIVSPECDVDILLHANVLRNFGQGSVTDGAEITVLTQKTERGVQATQVVAIAPPEPQDTLPLADLEGIDPALLTEVTLEPARVKWFDKVKGFGFANAFGKPDDIFIHIEILRASGFADLQPGEAISLRAIDGRRGLMAIQINAWEAGIEQQD
ncbi:cold-shock DNA-binding protein family [Poseidonocella pacifica]|uniref:Cold-shock DNA-binding protein family n=1 Tax=Poseidonocella pacifica TaxID=871651 RepID=A0A1I0VED8_9RHOB|nr:cold shock domain-containing protein [Poseidonocella pacifica]SFA74714.1 cold-shock DNA-binding protein family [Poseidonocella pacifica]